MAVLTGSTPQTGEATYQPFNRLLPGENVGSNRVDGDRLFTHDAKFQTHDLRASGNGAPPLRPGVVEEGGLVSSLPMRQVLGARNLVLGNDVVGREHVRGYRRVWWIRELKNLLRRSFGPPHEPGPEGATNRHEECRGDRPRRRLLQPAHLRARDRRRDEQSRTASHSSWSSGVQPRSVTSKR